MEIGNKTTGGNIVGDAAGFVSIVGAGPGDEGLFTIKGTECLKKADVVIYDYLANRRLLSYCNEVCEFVYVGKQAGSHTYRQDDINRLLVTYAREGKRVVRLKGGDPFVFGRGGEEVLALQEAGIRFEIVPGVTAGVAAPAFAGIPVTHREIASSVAFITGHEAAEKSESAIDWNGIAEGADTLVFYMGVKNLRSLMLALIQHGRSPNTPVAIIRWGTTPLQETVTATIETIADEAERTGIKPPAIIVVGEVVAYREKLRWYEDNPLFGKRIVVTRSRSQASTLAEILSDYGAQIDQFPTIEINPITDFDRLDRAMERLHECSWIVFTSVNGVRIFFDRLFSLGMDCRSLHACRFAVIGRTTAEELVSKGIQPNLVPNTFTSEGTIDAFREQGIDVNGTRVLLPGSEIARDYIPSKLREMGAVVETVPVYTNRSPSYTHEEVTAFFDPIPDLVTFTSSSTVENLVAIYKALGMESYLSRIQGASIGPITSETARKHNITIIVEARVHTIPGLVEAIVHTIGRKAQT